MMVSNVTGIPYRIVFPGESALAHDMVAHADWARFGVTVPGGTPDPMGARPDEFALAFGAPQNWAALGDAALATSAFPLAFRARRLERPLAGFGYRAVLVPGGADQPARVAQLLPRWPLLAEGQADAARTRFVNIDGGATNNEPLDAVRTAMCGLGGRNPRNAQEASRAVILVDPFTDPEALGPLDPPGLLGLAGSFINALVMQARFKPADIALAEDESVYSRFLVAPVGPGADNTRTVGARAIASGGLGGFLGFVNRRFLQHDFRLGRANAWRFLERHFAFPEDNCIVAGWTEAQKARFCVKQPALDANGQPNPTAGQPELRDGKRLLPMIPLMPGVEARPTTAVDWPALPGPPEWLPQAVGARLVLLVGQVKTEVAPKQEGLVAWLRRKALAAAIDSGWAVARRSAIDAAVQAIGQGLLDKKLVPPGSVPD